MKILTNSFEKIFLNNMSFFYYLIEEDYFMKSSLLNDRDPSRIMKHIFIRII